MKKHGETLMIFLLVILLGIGAYVLRDAQRYFDMPAARTDPEPPETRDAASEAAAETLPPQTIGDYDTETRPERKYREFSGTIRAGEEVRRLHLGYYEEDDSLPWCELTIGEQKIVIPLEEDFWRDRARGFVLWDVNQDGFLDVLIDHGLYGKICRASCYVYTPEGYRPVLGFEELGNPHWSESGKKLVANWPSQEWHRYHIDGRELVLEEKLTHTGSDCYTLQKWVDGEMTTVAENIPGDDVDWEYWHQTGGWEGAYRRILQDLASYLPQPQDCVRNTVFTDPLYLKLHDFDGDGTPEMIVADGWAGAVFTCTDDRAEKLADLYDPDEVWCVNGIRLRGNSLQVTCDGSDGSDYVNFGYLDGQYKLGHYNERTNGDVIINGEISTLEEMNSIYPTGQANFREDDLLPRLRMVNKEGVWVVQCFDEEKTLLEDGMLRHPVNVELWVDNSFDFSRFWAG